MPPTIVIVAGIGAIAGAGFGLGVSLAFDAVSAGVGFFVGGGIGAFVGLGISTQLGK